MLRVVTMFVVLDAAMVPLPVVPVVFLNLIAVVCSCDRFDWLVYDEKKQYHLALIKLPFVS